jgi:prepilin-type N-terminal cleavage/methylation domain-containing protein
MKTKMNKKGFTLVELLIVVAIIGILAAIVIVSLNSARDRTRVASLQSTMASIVTLAALCVNDGGNVVDPTNGQGGGNICSSTAITAETWPDLDAAQGLENSGYVYGTDAADISDTQLVAEDGTAAAVITCTVASGSCVRN